MPLVLVISSYVAASRVGGGIAPYVLGPMKVDPVHVPTCLFGRHPGWGPPGGGAVAADTMAKMLEGVEANNLFGLMDAVVTGHFSAPDQVAVACAAIDRIRATPRRESHEHFPAKPIVIIDPVMGDEAPGLYIKQETAAALVADLVPRADILAPNLWEFARLTGIREYESAERVQCDKYQHGDLSRPDAQLQVVLHRPGHDEGRAQDEPCHQQGNTKPRWRRFTGNHRRCHKQRRHPAQP